MFRILKLVGTAAALCLGSGANASPRQLVRREQQLVRRQDDLRRRERMRDATTLAR